MDEVVYVLGAGFSAPLGLPVSNNFLSKSKDLYFEDPEKYEHFKNVFAQINKLSVIKNYFESNLFNIEEILSILDMQTQLAGNQLSQDFNRYIKEVISFYTPSPARYDGIIPTNWERIIFGNEKKLEGYGHFVANLSNLSIERDRKTQMFVWSRKENPPIHYDVISLNYDTVLENINIYITNTLCQNDGLSFWRPGKDLPKDPASVPALAKLHGSIDSGSIIPPTWSKTLKPEIEEQWKTAHNLLRKANHIRIIGYSLPTTDTYVKYLFKSAIAEAEHLKSIHVVCLDASGETQRRYDEFVCFDSYRFFNESTEKYLECLVRQNKFKASRDITVMEFKELEEAHSVFTNS